MKHKAHLNYHKMTLRNYKIVDKTTFKQFLDNVRTIGFNDMKENSSQESHVHIDIENHDLPDDFLQQCSVVTVRQHCPHVILNRKAENLMKHHIKNKTRIKLKRLQSNHS
jgi:hypothetical protein